MKLALTPGSTSVICHVFIPDSTVTTGAGKTALAFGDITAYRVRAGGTLTAMTMETIGTLGTWASTGDNYLGFKKLEDTNAPGLYELDLPNNILVAGANQVVIQLRATGAAPTNIEIQLSHQQTGDLYAKMVIRAGTCQAGSTANTTVLDSGASATTNLYKGATILTTGGTGVGQVRVLNGYTGASKIATVDRPWATTPDNTTTFVILGIEAPALNANLQVTSTTNQSVIRTGSLQAGSTSNTAKLDSGASVTNNLYVGNLIALVTGLGLGQSRSIVSYNGSTKVATVDRTWNVTPDATTTFNILASTSIGTFSDQGVATAGGNTSITLAATASATSNLYIGSVVTILSGTGSGQTREITAYNGTSKAATVDSAWGVNPDATSAYAVIPTAGADITLPPTTPAPTTAEILAAMNADPPDVVLANAAMGGTSLVLTLGQIVVNSSAAGGAIDIDNSAGPGISITTGAAGGDGIHVDSSAAEYSTGFYIKGQDQGIQAWGGQVGFQSIGVSGVGIHGNGGESGIFAEGETENAKGFYATGIGTGEGVRISGGLNGIGLHVLGGSASGVGALVTAQGGNSNAITITGFGSGAGLSATGGATGVGVLASSMTVTAALTAGSNAVPWNSAWDTEVQSECADALTAYDPPTNAEMELRTIAAANYALEATLTAIKGATWSASTDTLEALRDRGDAAWITATGFPTLAEMNARTLVASAYATATALATAQGTLTKVETMIEIIP